MQKAPHTGHKNDVTPGEAQRVPPAEPLSGYPPAGVPARQANAAGRPPGGPLRVLTQLRVIIPVLLSAALLAFLFSISNVPDVFDQIRHIPLFVLVAVFALALFYLALKFLIWRAFMEGLRIPISLRHLVLAFAVGEMTLSLPAGIFAENFVLRRIAGADFSRSAAATSAVLVVEGALTLGVLAVIDVPGWGWLRPSILAIFALAAVLLGMLIAIRQLRHFAAWLLQLGPLRKIGPEFLEMVEGILTLRTPRLLALSIPLTGAYLFGLVAAFFLVGLGVGTPGFTLHQAASIYLFALGVVLISPVSTHLGVIEATGLGAMEAWGYDPSQALAALLGFRLVWTGATWLVCGPVVWLLRKEFESDHVVVAG